MEKMINGITQEWDPEQSEELKNLLDMQSVPQNEQVYKAEGEENLEQSRNAVEALVTAARIEEMKGEDPDIRKDTEQRQDHPVKIVDVSNDTYVLGEDDSFYRVEPMKVELVTKPTDPPSPWRHKFPETQPMPVTPIRVKHGDRKSKKEAVKGVEGKLKKRKRSRIDESESEVDQDNGGDILVNPPPLPCADDGKKNKQEERERKDKRRRFRQDKEIIKASCNKKPKEYFSTDKDDIISFMKGYNYDFLRQMEESRRRTTYVARKPFGIQMECCFDEGKQPLSPVLKRCVLPKVDSAEADDIKITPPPTPEKITKPKKSYARDPNLIHKISILRMTGETFIRIFKNIPTGRVNLLTRKLNHNCKKHFLQEIPSSFNASKIPNAAGGEPIWTTSLSGATAFGSGQSFVQTPISNVREFSDAHVAVKKRLITPEPLQQDLDLLLRQTPRFPGVVLNSRRSHQTISSTSLVGLSNSSILTELPPSFREIRAEIVEDAARLIFTRRDKQILMKYEPFSKDVRTILPEYEDGIFHRGNIPVEKEMEKMTLDNMLQGLERAPFHCEHLIHIKQSITCPECGHVYVYPKALKCMHMICANCCLAKNELSANVAYKSYRCKECFEVTHFDKWGLLGCFFMTEMARFLYSILCMREHFRCTYHPPNGRPHMIATIRCKKCRLNFCETCFNFHSTRNLKHNQPEWLGSHWAYRDEYDPPQVIRCKRHDEKTIDIFCRRCSIGCCRLCRYYFHPHHDVLFFIPASKYVKEMKLKILFFLNKLFPGAMQHLDKIERKIHAISNYYRFKTGEGKEVVNHLKTRLQKIIDTSLEPIRYKRQPEWQKSIQRLRNIQKDIQKRYVFLKRLRILATVAEVPILTQSPFLENTQKLIETALPNELNPYFQNLRLVNPEVSPILSLPIVEYPFFHRVKVIDAMRDSTKAIQSITYRNGDLIAVHFDTDHRIPSSYYLHCQTHERQIHWTRKLRQCPKLYKVAFFQKCATTQNEATEKLLALEYYDRKEKVYKNDFEIEIDETSYHHLRAIDIDKNIEDYCTYLGDERYKPTAMCSLRDEGFAYFSKSIYAHSYGFVFQSPFMTEDKLKIDKRKVLEKYVSYPCAVCYGPHQHIYVLDKNTNNICSMDYCGFFTRCIQLGTPKEIEVLDMCSSDTHFMILARYNDTMDDVIVQYSFRNNTRENVLTRQDGLEHSRCITWNNDDCTLYVGCDDGKIREFQFPVVRKQKIAKASLEDKEKCCDKDRRAEKVNIATQTPIE